MSFKKAVGAGFLVVLGMCAGVVLRASAAPSITYNFELYQQDVSHSIENINDNRDALNKILVFTNSDQPQIDAEEQCSRALTSLKMEYGGECLAIDQKISEIIKEMKDLVAPTVNQTSFELRS